MGSRALLTLGGLWATAASRRKEGRAEVRQGDSGSSPLEIPGSAGAPLLPQLPLLRFKGTPAVVQKC